MECMYLFGLKLILYKKILISKFILFNFDNRESIEITN